MLLPGPAEADAAPCFDLLGDLSDLDDETWEQENLACPPKVVPPAEPPKDLSVVQRQPFRRPAFNRPRPAPVPVS